MFLIKRFFKSLRNIYLFYVKYSWVKYGDDVSVQNSCYFFSKNKRTVIGNRVGIGKSCSFQCDIKIGDDVMIAAYCGFVSKDAHVTNVVGRTMSQSPRGDKFGIIIEDDVWVGFGATILSNVRLGKGSVIAAGSVVTKNVLPYSIVGGNPAKLLKVRFSGEDLKLHESLLKRGVK